MFEVDEELKGPMRAVEWHTITEAEMTSFGLQLSLLKDADLVREKASSTFWARAGAALSVCVLTVVLLLFGVDPIAVLIGVCISQLAGTGAAMWRRHVAQRDVKESQGHVIEELNRLAVAHPVK